MAQKRTDYYYYINTLSLVANIGLTMKWTFTVTLTTTVKFLNKTLQLMIMYQPIKFDCKKVSSSADVVERARSDCMSPHWDFDLENNKPISSHDTDPFWCITIPRLVTKGAAIQKTLSGQTLRFWTFAVTSTSKKANQTSKKANQTFQMTLWLMMMHHHTNFDNKMVQWFRYCLDKHSLTMWPWTRTQQSNFLNLLGVQAQITTQAKHTHTHTYTYHLQMTEINMTVKRQV